MNQSDNHTSRRQNHRINRGLALAVFGIVATGVAADAYATLVITEDGRDCFVCTNVKHGTTCNDNNANFARHCSSGDSAHCDYNNNTGEFTSSCSPDSLGIL